MSQQEKGKLNVCWTYRPVTRLGHQGGEEFSNRVTNLIVSKYLQHIFPVGVIFSREASPPPSYGPVDFYTSQK